MMFVQRWSAHGQTAASPDTAHLCHVPPAGPALAVGEGGTMPQGGRRGYGVVGGLRWSGRHRR